MNEAQIQMTTPHLLELAARKYPQREFLVCGDARMTYSQVDKRVNALANGLLSLGIERGDRVGSYLANCPEILENYMASNRIGAIPVPINFRLAPEEVAWILNHAQAKAVFVGSEFLDVLDGIRTGLDDLRHVIVVGGRAPRGTMDYEELISRHSTSPPGIQISQDDPAMLMYTAGTTGFPKGVLCTHRNNLWSIFNSVTYDLMLGRVRPSDTMAYPLPFFHKAAYITAVRQLMQCGRCIIMRKFDPDELLWLIERERINLFAMVPAVANAILQSPSLRKHDLSSLNTVRCTGAPMPVALKERFAETFPDVDICDNYGMTEIPTISMHVSRGRITNPLTVGRPHPLTEVQIMNDQGEVLPAGQVGEICVRSPGLFKEYFQNPRANEEAFRGGWFHTADMGTFDEEGNLYIKDRKKDMIIAGGENIYPAEVEQVLFSHPKVLEAACIGIPDERFGEAVMAVVVVRPGESLSEQELIDYCSRHLGRFKVPKRVEFVEELPKSAVGKVLRRELRVRFGGITVRY